MGILSFFKDAGEKLFGKNVEDQPSQEEKDAAAAAAIAKYIETQALGATNVGVKFDGATATVTVEGDAPSREVAEKVTLCCGNVAGVSHVSNEMNVPDSAPESQYHEVVRGDTLSAIAKKVYGDANKYMVIFEANKPMLGHPDKIYPGQTLRIPALV